MEHPIFWETGIGMRPIACCDFTNSGVDDVGYLSGLIDAIQQQRNIDPDRIYVIGHSNGGFMAYRLACERADLLAAIASLAGATFFDPLDCNPSEPVHTLQIHGTADATINYQGGVIPANLVSYPGAVATVETWAGYNGCAIMGEPIQPDLDLDSGLAGAETMVTRYATNCMPGGSSALWTIEGGGHLPQVSQSFGPLLIDYLLAHPKNLQPCLADLDGDGNITVQDLNAAIGGWSCATDCPGDLNGDTQVNILDLVTLRNAFGACPSNGA